MFDNGLPTLSFDIPLRSDKYVTKGSVALRFWVRPAFPRANLMKGSRLACAVVVNGYRHEEAFGLARMTLPKRTYVLL